MVTKENKLQEQRAERGRPFFARSSEKKDEFDSKLLDLARVTRMTAGGRRFKFRAVMVVGNRAGKVGFGIAKGSDAAQAIDKSTRAAKKNLFDVLIVDGTIPHQTEAKYGPAEVVLKPQRKGKGLVAGGVVRVICDLSGIKDISSKVLGRTRNKINNIVATITALKKLRSEKSTKEKK